MAVELLTGLAAGGFEPAGRPSRTAAPGSSKQPSASAEAGSTPRRSEEQGQAAELGIGALQTLLGAADSLGSARVSQLLARAAQVQEHAARDGAAGVSAGGGDSEAPVRISLPTSIQLITQASFLIRGLQEELERSRAQVGGVGQVGGAEAVGAVGDEQAGQRLGTVCSAAQAAGTNSCGLARCLLACGCPPAGGHPGG